MDIRRLKLEIKFQMHKNNVLNEIENCNKYLEELTDIDDIQRYVLKYTESIVRFIKILNDTPKNDDQKFQEILLKNLNKFLDWPTIKFETILKMQEIIDGI